MFWVDNAHNHFNQTLSSFFQSKGFTHEYSCVYTSQQNGVAKRKNNHPLTNYPYVFVSNHMPLLRKSCFDRNIPYQQVTISDTRPLSPIEVLTTFFPKVQITLFLESLVVLPVFIYINFNEGNLTLGPSNVCFGGCSLT